MKLLIFVIIIWAGYTSCCKCSTNHSDDNEQPKITLNALSSGQIFTGSQTIQIAGEVKDNKYIKEIHIEVTDMGTNPREYLHVHIHPNAATATFNQNFTIQPGIIYTVKVTAEDGVTYPAIKSVNIVCN